MFAAENPSPTYIGYMPAQRGSNRHERIFQRCHVVATTNGRVVDKRDIGWRPSDVEAELAAVPMIDIEVAVGALVVVRDQG